MVVNFSDSKTTAKVNIPDDALSFFETERELLKQATPMLNSEASAVKCSNRGFIEVEVEAHAGEVYTLH